MSELIPKPEISSITELAIAIKDGRYKPAASGEGALFKLIKVCKSMFSQYKFLSIEGNQELSPQSHWRKIRSDQ